MPPDAEKGRPRAEAAFRVESGDFDIKTLRYGPDVRGQLARRRVASWRLPLLADGRRDPLDPPDRPGPCSFGLFRAELVAEVRRCRSLGWGDWELRTVFVNPSEMAA
ncbi:hypothetical protein AB0395_27410 [Streptosporangium sp. NPDC051023]|uniref:hypothetical protein n=1 Tax=Streptosporangium sp. NPDC051023 TaxID=3155410 RepID=UPI00344F8FC0